MEGTEPLSIVGVSHDSQQSSPTSGSGTGSTLHVLTLTPFFPFVGNEALGCFIKEPIEHIVQLGVACSVFAVSPVYARRTPSASAPACWVTYPQMPGKIGLSSSGWFLHACLVRRVTQLHRERPIDLIHAHAALPCGHAAALLSRRLMIPYVVTVHGLDVFNTHLEHGAWVRWRRQRSVEVYESARTVICVSGKVQAILHNGMPRGVRSNVVYNSVDVNRFSPGSGATNPSRPALLAVGDLIPTKGQELIVRAIARLASPFPHLCGQFIGEGPDRARLESLSSELGIAQRVQFSGRRSRAEVAEAMRNCSVFVLPSRSEGLGCVYLEAMACGKPVIACRGQGIEEVIEPECNGWVISPDSLDELVQALSTLLQSHELCSKIGSAGRETILNRFTLVHQARALAGIYREAIAPR